MMDIKSDEKVFGVEAWVLEQFLVPGMLVMGAILTLFLVILPKINEINSVANKNIVLKKQTADLEQKKNYLLTLSEDDLKQKTFLLNQALPQDKNVYFLLTVVKTIAAQYNFTVASFSVSPGKLTTETADVGTKELTKIPVKVSLTGPSDAYLALIKGIERSLPVLSIDQFKLDQVGLSAQLDLTVSTYFSNATTEIKVKNLSLNDLSMTTQEAATVASLSAYVPLSGLKIGDTGGQQYVDYQRQDPFSP